MICEIQVSTYISVSKLKAHFTFNNWLSRCLQKHRRSTVVDISVLRVNIFNFCVLQTHTDNCDFFVISCPNGCGVDFERRFKDKHVNEDCTCRKLSCEFCKEPYQEKDEMEHLNSCMKFPIPCPAGCKKKDIPRELVSGTRQEWGCNVMLECSPTLCGPDDWKTSCLISKF